MSQKLQLEDFVGILNDHPGEDCVVSQEVAGDFGFSLREAAERSGRELREGAEYVPGTSFRKRIYVFFRKENN